MNDEGICEPGSSSVQVCAAIRRRRGVKIEEYIKEVNNLDGMSITRLYNNDGIGEELLRM